MKLTEQEKQERREARKAARQAAKEAARIEAERNQKPVKTITINIEWIKSRTWDYNPHAEATVEYWDGSFERVQGFSCSGCGYDKKSTVISDIFDKFLKYKLWNLEEYSADWRANNDKPRPYGIDISSRGRGYAVGIGTNCFYDISKYIGGGFEEIAGGNSFDAYRYTDKGF